MADVSSVQPLISQHPSTSGLQIALHPLALLTISDYITRHTLRNQSGPILGALLGSQSGREIAIEYAYEILLKAEESHITIDKTWFETKLRLFKETHPTADLLGWFTTTGSPQFAPVHTHIAVHQELLRYNESLVLLLLNPSSAAAVRGGGKLPVAIYESIYEADEADAKKLGLKFVPLNYTIESGEAEMIGMDFVAKGAGNASSVPNTGATPEADGGGGSNGGGKPVDGSGKGKEKEQDAVVASPKDEDGAATAATAAATASATASNNNNKIDVGVQNDELLANLTSKKNAIMMLNARIKLLLTYLQHPPHGVPDHQILREIKSLTTSRLPLLRPANSRAFEREKMAEESDVNLVVLLGAITKSIEDVRIVGLKSAAIDAVVKVGKKSGAGYDEGLDFQGMGGGGPGRRSRGFGF